MNQQLRNIFEIMGATSRPWGFCGGWGLDLFLGRETRPHQDFDIAVFRQDQKAVHEHLTARSWTCRKVIDGNAVPWQKDEFNDLPCHEVWCHKASFDPPKFEMLLNESDRTHFIFRRDSSVRMPFDRAILKAACGLPVLAPEIILLYKSKDFESGNNVADFGKTVGQLDDDARQWLRAALGRQDPQHPWLRNLGGE
jgi:hypothetical protein